MMIMDEKCPYCGSEEIEFVEHDVLYECGQVIVTWKCRCSEGHEFIASEVYTLASRLIAKDDDELDRLIEEESKAE